MAEGEGRGRVGRGRRGMGRGIGAGRSVGWAERGMGGAWAERGGDGAGAGARAGRGPPRPAFGLSQPLRPTWARSCVEEDVSAGAVAPPLRLATRTQSSVQWCRLLSG